MPKVTDWDLTNMINNDFVRDSFSEPAIIPSVRYMFKKSERSKLESYTPVSILDYFSKIWKIFTWST